MFKLVKVFVVSVTLTLGWVNGSVAASFDCNKASSETEVAICHSDLLSALDEILSTSYSLALDFSDDVSSVRDQQREWLQKRNDVGADERDLLNVLSTQIHHHLSSVIGFHFSSIENSLKNSLATKFDKDLNERVMVISSQIGINWDAPNIALIFDTEHRLSHVWFDTDSLTLSNYKMINNANDNISTLYNSRTDIWRTIEFKSEYKFDVNAKCISLSKVSQNDLSKSLEWTKNPTKQKCILENNNHLVGLNPDITIDGDTSKLGFLKFLINYWTSSTIELLNDTNEVQNPCSDQKLSVTRIKLINLFNLMEKSGEFNEFDNFHHPKENLFVSEEIRGWDYNFTKALELYKKNPEKYDAFLPALKIMDGDGSISEAIEYLLLTFEDPELNNIEDVTNCEGYIKVRFSDANGNGTISYSPDGQRFLSYIPSFWERRSNEGNSNTTYEILKKMKKALEG